MYHVNVYLISTKTHKRVKIYTLLRIMASSKFFSRLVKFKHMEFDAALQQLAWAVVSPKKL